MPKKFSAEVGMEPKRLLRRLSGDMVEHRGSVNVLSQSRFMREHREESVFYGFAEKDSLRISYHCARKRDGGSTGFYGRVTDGGNGPKTSVIEGTFRKPLYAYIFSGVFVLLCLLCALGAYAAGSGMGAAVFIATGALGAVLMLYDDHEKMIRNYLEGLCEESQKKK
ncbi:MAG: hypothetical protein IJ806_10215 [Ruminococcus sp.]|nr:hypothetical protein [Ruminococcus sp.]